MNSSFLLAHGDQYNLANTTPELLKFQLQEQNRMEHTPQLGPLLLDPNFNSHLQSVLMSKEVSIDDSENEANDEFPGAGALGVSTPALEVLETKLDVHTPNYLNLKVLIENLVFDTAKINQRAIMSLPKVQAMKRRIADKQEHKDYLQKRIGLSSQFCTLIFNSDSPDLDSSLVLKVLKQNIDLQEQLMTLSAELDALTTALNNHNLACLVLGYVEDVKFQSAAPIQNAPHAESSMAFESLFSHIALVAAQRNVALPEHPEESDVSLQGKVEWAQGCIDAILASGPETPVGDRSILEDNSVLRDHSFLSASPYKAINAPQEKVLSEYKLALNDLRFSHKYFMKEYDYLKENSLKTISEYRKKNAILEEEMQLLRLPDVGTDSLDAKDKEIALLRKELSLMKIETLGNKASHNPQIASPSLLSGMEGEEHTADVGDSPQSVYKYGQSMSNAILRKEFKKIVLDIQDQYEVELGEERLKRRQLEAQLQESK